jgi:hypothetical protein
LQPDKNNLPDNDVEARFLVSYESGGSFARRSGRAGCDADEMN